MSFGDISKIAYTDRSDPRKEIQVVYKVGHGLLMAVNSQHNDIRVKISEDCKVDRENPSPSRTSDCDSHSRKKKRNKELRVHPTDVIGTSNTSPEYGKPRQSKCHKGNSGRPGDWAHEVYREVNPPESKKDIWSYSS